MADPASVADQALKKLADQLECSICLESFTDPKLLQCFHMFCKDCLQSLVLQDQHGKSLRCPKCLRSTLLPVNGVSDLQSAFHIHHLFDIRDALVNVKHGQEGHKAQCKKCKRREANGFCRDCGKFVCEVCIEMHQTWEELLTHKVISLDELNSNATEMVPLAKKTLYCSKHLGKELDLFCETDQELICRDCIVKTHRDHQYDLVSEVFPKHRDAITSHLEPVKQQLSTLNKAIQDLEKAQGEVMDQRDVIEADIQRIIRQLHEALEMRKIGLIGQLDQITQQKLNTLSRQRDELELIQTWLISCLEFVSDSLRIGSEGEILAMEKPVVQQVKELCTEMDYFSLLPQGQADMTLTASSELLTACQQFGQVHISQVCPEKCYATGKGLEVATVGEQSTVTVHTIDKQSSKCTKSLPLSNISCELVSCSNAERIKCEVKSEDSEYKVTYCCQYGGKHQLHIKVSNTPISGSPFTVVALRKLNAPMTVITGLKQPRGVAVDGAGQIFVSEFLGHCISVYNQNGEKIKSFGRESPSQLFYPHGIVLDKDDSLLIVDEGNHQIRKFAAGGTFEASIGSKGDNPLQFDCPVGIGINPGNKVFVCDRNNHRVQILNPDLTFSDSFGSKGSGDGQFKFPWDVAFDSRGNVYVADSENHCIQVFTEDGHFLRKFCKRGDGELKWPTSVAIDSDDVVYVVEQYNHRISLFTSEGHFLISFGVQGKELGQFNQPLYVAVDKGGRVYVSDCFNYRLQVL